ncbi:AraC family transcriptional regulator [Aurantibacter crassamenti]|uniref:AraC family transcriptional regulator n=1 Tax=Aurantibacter crassamenti TaxID=1837375 RepID=UPI00193AA7A0|nr:helix-turn-helix domain-containing protein [Aurantibacter crassamenti]MBM1107823.1 AraC family transcriptional regulator [Aurantibacter crassamenti]
MQYKKFKPDKALSEFVECYFSWEGTTDGPRDLESPPSALCSLVFNLGDAYEISNYKYERNSVPKTFIGGQAIKNYTLHLEGNISMIGAVLKPSALFNFYNIPMYGFTGERIDFLEVEKEMGADIQCRMKKAVNTQKRIAIIEEYFLGRLASTNFATKEIVKAANEIYDKKGHLNVLEFLESVPMSRRNFERKFLNEVGVSPKTYAKIRRFGNTCLLMSGKREVNLMDVLHEGGYYDQSHFIKDFKYFSGRTPKKYAKTNVELANYIDQVSIVERRLFDEN